MYGGLVGTTMPLETVMPDNVRRRSVILLVARSSMRQRRQGLRSHCMCPRPDHGSKQEVVRLMPASRGEIVTYVPFLINSASLGCLRVCIMYSPPPLMIPQPSSWSEPPSLIRSRRGFRLTQRMASFQRLGSWVENVCNDGARDSAWVIVDIGPRG